MASKLCDYCLSTPCPKVEATRSLLGNWAREKRRQGAQSILHPTEDKEAMNDAMREPVDSVFEAICDCKCHEISND